MVMPKTPTMLLEVESSRHMVNDHVVACYRWRELAGNDQGPAGNNMVGLNATTL
jgi:hypothetical protein